MALAESFDKKDKFFCASYSKIKREILKKETSPSPWHTDGNEADENDLVSACLDVPNDLLDHAAGAGPREGGPCKICSLNPVQVLSVSLLFKTGYGS